MESTTSMECVGGARLDLLCHTAIMQQGEQTPLHLVETSPAQDLMGRHDLKSLPSRSGASKASRNPILVPASKKARWSPPSFVDLKDNKTPSLVPVVPCQTAKVPLFPLSQSTKSLKALEPRPDRAIASETCFQDIEPKPSTDKLSYKELINENVQLKIELGEAKKEIARLKKDINKASCNISELRGSLTGGNKISEIPLEDMIEIMQEYGSEVSGQSFQKRKEDPQPASIVRQFRRWNPDFLKYFYRKNGKWLPKLGKAGELQRRKLKRDALRAHRRNPPHAGPPSTHAS